MTDPLCRAYDAETQVQPGERAVVATINTDSVDRYNTVIVPRGANLDNYRRNPIVLLNHDPAQQVGRNAWITNKGGVLRAKTIFMGADLSDEADKTFRKYQEGFMRGFSITFNPDMRECGPPTKRELDQRPDWQKAKMIYRSWELIEYSAVAIPANPDAVIEAVSRGFLLPEWAEHEAPVTAVVLDGLPPLVGRTFAEVERALSRQIKEMAAPMMREAIQEAQDRARGRI